MMDDEAILLFDDINELKVSEGRSTHHTIRGNTINIHYEHNQDSDGTSIAIPAIVQIDSNEEINEMTKTGDNRENADCPSQDKDELLRKFHAENLQLSVSIECLEANHESEIAILEEELNKKNEMHIELLNIKEGMAKQNKENSMRIAELETKLLEAQNQLQFERNSKENLENKISNQRAKIFSLERTITDMKNRLDAKRSKVEDWENMYAAYKTQLAERNELSKKLVDTHKLLELEREEKKTLAAVRTITKYVYLETTTGSQLDSERLKVKTLQNALLCKDSQLEKNEQRVKHLKLDIKASIAKAAERESELKKLLQLEREKVATAGADMLSICAHDVNIKERTREVTIQLDSEISKVQELENVVVENYTDLEKMKERAKQLKENLTDVESELIKCKKIIELREKHEKLQLEQELDEERVEQIQRRAKRVLEESEVAATNSKKAKEERLKEMEKILTKLSVFE